MLERGQGLLFPSHLDQTGEGYRGVVLLFHG